MKKVIGYSIVVLCFFIVCSAEAGVFDVSNVAEFQAALTAAQGNGEDDTINLAAGTYAVGSRMDYIPDEFENFSLTIQGAGSWATILDGGNSSSILRIEQGALSEETGTNANVTITGVAFQNGSESSELGGALYIGNYYAQTTIADSVFRNNTAVFGGGALYVNGLNVSIAGSSFIGNSSADLSSLGGAVYALILGGTLSLEGNTFSDNFSVGSGAGIFATNPGPIVLTGNVFSGNVAGGEGGGGYVSAEFGGSLSVSGNTFSGNSGSSSGGALLSCLSGSAIISGNIFGDNIAMSSSESDGGGVTVFSQGSLEMVNNLFTDNTASQRGAGAIIYLFSHENQITNNTFVGNSSTGTYNPGGSVGGGMCVVADRNEAVLNIYNNIFWGNTAAAPSDSGADAYINDDGLNDEVGCTIHLYNNNFSSNLTIEIVRGDHLSEGGNITGNPNLDSDYRLTSGSPCRDSGNNGAPGLPGTDLVGNPRIQGANVDMGAYEWGPSGSLRVTIEPEGAVDAGGQWRRVGASAWRDSGTTETGVLAGQHTVEFRDVSGWTKPGNQAVTISEGQGATAAGSYTGQVGSLQVTISPQGAINAGAKWRVDGGVWQDSGYRQTVSVGTHTVGFSEVVGLTNPGIETVVISEGEAETVTRSYTGQIGSLRVTISPQGAVNAGAHWRVGGGVWHGSGETQTVSVGQHTVEFSDVAGWTKPGNRTVTISNGQTTDSSGAYTQPTGSLRVTIAPQGAIDAGARWRVDGGTWQVSGYTQTVSVGSHTVSFSDVAGWTKPGNRTVTISNGHTTTGSGTYTQPTGSLRVTIYPQEAIDAGAQWRVDGGAWHVSGDEQTGLLAGQHTVEFSDVTGWAKPGNRVVTINTGQTATLTGTYTTGIGSLQVTIVPQGAIDAGAQWRVDGGAWHVSGEIQAGLSVGQHLLEFSTVAGWTKPTNQTVTISEDQTTTTTGTYTPRTSSLRVTISPQEAISAGAQWRRVGTSLWFNSDTTESGILVGSYTVEFSAVAGWANPANQTVTISEGQTTTASGTYTLQTGSLRVTISPQGAVSAGAQWRRVGTSTWINSDTTEPAIPVAQHTVEFSDAVGWTKPVNQAVTISEGQTATMVGTYTLTLQTGSLRVTISPQGAISAGAQWRRVGTSAWINSDTTEPGIAVAQHTVEFSDAVGWTKPGNQTVTISDGQTATMVGTYTTTTASLLFFDDFSTNKGWSGYEVGGWERRPAHAGSPELGNPDPAADYTPTEDNYILGYAIGGYYANDLPAEKEIISPAIDCTGQVRVFLKFWRYLNVEGNDNAGIYISKDRTNWLPIWENPETGTMDNQWTPVIFDISEVAAGEGSVYIKFTMGPTDSAIGYSGWNIDDLEVNSNPVHPAEGTIGTEFSIAGYDFGVKKGKVLIGNTSVTILSWSAGLIRCRLTKALAAGNYDVTIVPSLPKGSASIIYNEAVFLVKPPEIYSLDQDDGTAWDGITIHGRFFGTKKGKVYLEYEEGGNPVRKNCKVRRWAMDPASGDGEIVFVVPSMMPEVCDVVVEPFGDLPESEEHDGFTVKAPEIVSVDPNAGTTGNEITIRGYFFGTKKPKVYLGHDMNGKAEKKSCSVVRWTVADPSTGEGDIVCKVPKGLPEGIYDVIVTNSVGSDTKPGILTIQPVY